MWIKLFGALASSSNYGLFAIHGPVWPKLFLEHGKTEQVERIREYGVDCRRTHDSYYLRPCSRRILQFWTEQGAKGVEVIF